MTRVKAAFGPFVAVACAASFLSACSGGEENTIESFCEVMTDLDNNDTTLGLEEGSPEFFEAVVDSFQTAADAAPEEIRGDLESLASAMEDISGLADDPEGNAEEVLETITELQPVTERLDAYLETNCDI